MFVAPLLVGPDVVGYLEGAAFGDPVGALVVGCDVGVSYEQSNVSTGIEPEYMAYAGSEILPIPELTNAVADMVSA